MYGCVCTLSIRGLGRVVWGSNPESHEWAAMWLLRAYIQFRVRHTEVIESEGGGGDLVGQLSGLCGSPGGSGVGEKGL